MERLREERIRLGLTLADAAKQTGFSASELEGWESGRAEPLGSQLVKLSLFYGCSPDWLLDLSEDRDAGLVEAYRIELPAV